MDNFTFYNADVIDCSLTRWDSSHNKNVGGLLGKALCAKTQFYIKAQLILSF